VTEIRTRDTLLAYTRFPGVPLQPLEHHSIMLMLADQGGIFVCRSEGFCFPDAKLVIFAELSRDFGGFLLFFY
ncbi:MAG: hypothetical protein K2F87_01060, partial [Muribaculaceae bacterium]|nr:hypothetical protein [Muribaculaceae bacterium]